LRLQRLSAGGVSYAALIGTAYAAKAPPDGYALLQAKIE
jgi:hypothetical protein